MKSVVELMSKITLVCPANISQMPYLGNYLDVLNNNSITYELIVWDRFWEDNTSDFIFRDKKKGHSRDSLDYYRFSSFVRKVLLNNSCDKAVVFGIPLAFFMADFLIRKLSKKYIVDIRDHHKAINLFPHFKWVLKSSALNVISSGRYLDWLPKGVAYLVSHNTRHNFLRMEERKSCLQGKKKYSVSCIGALKDFEINRCLLEAASDRAFDKFVFNFHGEGVINNEIISLSDTLNNVEINVTGRYPSCAERDLYLNSDFINMFMSANSLNNKTCLSNRLYNASFYGVPLLAIQGSYMSDIISKFHLGLVFFDIHDLYLTFDERIKDFDWCLYESGRSDFFKMLAIENDKFKAAFLKFSVESFF